MSGGRDSGSDTRARPWNRTLAVLSLVAGLAMVPVLSATSLGGGTHGRTSVRAPLQEEAVLAGEPVVVASKTFAESLLLGEVFSQLLEARGIRVDRRPGLGSTEIIFQALVNGGVDVYPEYTGTGLLVILGEDATASQHEVYRRVSAAFRTRWGIRWLPPLGFQNTYAVAVRSATADSLGLETLSGLAGRAPELVAGLTPDFIGRNDGLPGLERRYGIQFREVRPLLQAVKYRALAEGEVDVIDGYSTDGSLDRYPLSVLRDDRAFFPPYEAAALVGREVSETRPEVLAALGELSGLLDEVTMRRVNRRVETEAIPVEVVARELLGELGLVAGAVAGSTEGTPPERTGFFPYLWSRRGETLALTLEHLLLVGVSLLAAIAVAVPGGLALAGHPSRAESVIRGVGLLQTVPSIALLAFMIPLLGIGAVPAATALFLYSLLPVIRNTYTGVEEADPAAVRAGTALGMTGCQVLLQVRLPLAAPVIMAGIRTAAVINVGTATLAAFIGAGGLGEPIVAGLSLSDTRLILSGALPAAVLAVGVDTLLAQVERAVAPRGLREPTSPPPSPAPPTTGGTSV